MIIDTISKMATAVIVTATVAGQIAQIVQEGIIVIIRKAMADAVVNVTATETEM
jgi:hypothetical protein